MQITFSDDEIRDIDPDAINVTTWNPRRAFALAAVGEVVHDLARGFDVTLSDLQVTLLVNGVQRDCHVIQYLNFPVRTLVLSFDLGRNQQPGSDVDDSETGVDEVMTVLLFSRHWGGEEEWFFSTKGLILPSRDPLEWGGNAAELDDGSQDEMNVYRGALIIGFVAKVLANNWFGERPITPAQPQPGM